jgi:glucose-1-phosphate cytidylyltransferase
MVEEARSQSGIKLVILAGGLGTRIAEESDTKPKPMIEIGGKPILLHIMEHYSKHGITDFVICVGYKGYVIKEYFYNFLQHTSDFTVDLGDGTVTVDKRARRSWKISIVDTGPETMTGGRVKRVAHLLGDTFLLTYGDGLCDANIGKEIAFHEAHGKNATVLAVRPPSRFAVLGLADNSAVSSFKEKPPEEVGWINGGFFVLNKKVVDLIVDDNTSWEREPLETLARTGELMGFRHEGFWQPVDTLRDKRHLDQLWAERKGPWRDEE